MPKYYPSPIPQSPSTQLKAASAFSVALTVAVAALAAFTPVSTAAHPQSETGPYVNTQFVEGQRAEDTGRLVIRNTSVLPRKVYARFEMPGDEGNRNYGFIQSVPPLSSLTYVLPVGVRVFACDGKYWDNYRPDEALAVTIAKPDTYSFTARQFKPTALRRAKGS